MIIGPPPKFHGTRDNLKLLVREGCAVEPVNITVMEVDGVRLI